MGALRFFVSLMIKNWYAKKFHKVLDGIFQ